MGLLALSDAGAALLSGAVAAIVSLAVGALTYQATMRGHRAERIRLERDLQRTMTAKLYDRRMVAYPKAWAITEALRASSMDRNGARNDPEYFRSVLVDLDRWAATDGAMILSSESIEALYETRRALPTDTRRNRSSGSGRPKVGYDLSCVEMWSFCSPRNRTEVDSGVVEI